MFASQSGACSLLPRSWALQRGRQLRIRLSAQKLAYPFDQCEGTHEQNWKNVYPFASTNRRGGGWGRGLHTRRISWIDIMLIQVGWLSHNCCTFSSNREMSKASEKSWSSVWLLRNFENFPLSWLNMDGGNSNLEPKRNSSRTREGHGNKPCEAKWSLLLTSKLTIITFALLHQELPQNDHTDQVKTIK